MVGNSTEPDVNSSEVPPGCLVLQPLEFLPWDNPDNVVSMEAEQLVMKLKDLVVLPIAFLIGVPANIINMMVFYRHGLKERINVCLLALSLADGLYLACNMLWYGEQLYLQFTTKEIYGPVMVWMANHYLLGFYAFTTVSQVLSAIIASERCLCILHPLRSHTLFPTSTTTTIVVAVFVVVVGMYFLVVTRYYISCAYDPVADRTVLLTTGGEFYHQHREFIDVLDIFVYGTGLPWLVVTVVIITTVVTVIKLHEVTEWRAGVTSGGGGGSGGGGVSARDIALTRMLVGSSIFFIACVFPFSVFRLVTMVIPEISAGRRYHNLFMVGLWLLNIFSYINSTFNFVVYYAMGSRYRHTVWTLMRRRMTTDTPKNSSDVVDKTTLTKS